MFSFFFSSRRRHTRYWRDWSSDVCSSDLAIRITHIFVGAGDGPCVILMAGARLENEQLHYPVSELAARYGASVEEETSDFKQVYVRFEPSRRGRPSYWDQLPWA